MFLLEATGRLCFFFFFFSFDVTLREGSRKDWLEGEERGGWVAEEREQGQEGQSCVVKSLSEHSYMYELASGKKHLTSSQIICLLLI